MLSLLTTAETDTVLDMCTGAGAAVPLLLEQLDDNGLIVATDLSYEMLRATPKKHSAALQRVATQANGYSLPFADESFDLVFCLAGLAHFHKPQQALCEMARTLKPGGRLAIVFLSCSHHIDNIHKKIGGAVAHDKVPSLSCVDKWFTEMGLTTTFMVNEKRRLYLASAVKESNLSRARAISNIVNRQLKRYPQATAQDLYKSLHQATMGTEHALSDIDGARNYLKEELAKTKADDSMPLLESIGIGSPMYRVHLAPFKARKLPEDSLFSAFAETAKLVKPPLSLLEFVLDTVLRSYEDGQLPLLPAGFADYVQEQKAAKFPARHHSSLFRQHYAPAYRVISPATGLVPWLTLEDVITAT